MMQMRRVYLSSSEYTATNYALFPGIIGDLLNTFKHMSEQVRDGFSLHKPPGKIQI